MANCIKIRVLFFILIISTILTAQENTKDTYEISWLEKHISYSGNFGVRFESNSSLEDYLPDAIASTYFNLNISAGLVGLNLNGELSSSDARFSPEFVKRLGISQDIGFLHMDIGDHYPRYSKLVMSGAKVRGLGFSITPGNFIFGMTGGRIRVGGANINGSYRREAYGMQMGYKSKKFELISQFSRLNDLPSEIDSIYLPQESLTGGLKSKLVIWNNIRVQGDVAVSLHTRDKTSMSLDTSLSFMGINLNDMGIQLRTSSRIDYAYSYDVFIPVKMFQFIYKRDYIGPGFHTLGTPSLRNDILKDMFRTSVKLFRGKFFAGFMYLNQKNNLRSEKAQKTFMDNYLITTRIKPTGYFNFSGKFSILNRERISSGRNFNYDKCSYSLTPEFIFKTWPVNNRISLNYGSNLSEFNDVERKSVNLKFRYMGNMDNGYSFFTDINRNDYDNGNFIRHCYTIGAAKRFQKIKANISIRTGFGDSKESNISANFTLPWNFQLTTDISLFRMINYRYRFRFNISKSF